MSACIDIVMLRDAASDPKGFSWHRCGPQVLTLLEAIDRAFYLAIPYVVDAADSGDVEAEGDLRRLRTAFDPLFQPDPAAVVAADQTEEPT